MRAGGECQNLHTATLRVRYSQCGQWGGTRADIRSQALRSELLAPANSAHLRSLRIWWCTADHFTQYKHSSCMRPSGSELPA